MTISKPKPLPKAKEPSFEDKPLQDADSPDEAVVVSTTPEPELPSKPAPTGTKFAVPMTFNEAPIAEVPKYIEDPDFFFQQKVDGIRGQLVIEPGKKPWFRSRSGQQLQNSSATKVTGPMLKSLGTMPDSGPSYTVDGELLNGKWYVFDVVVDGSEKVPYEDRAKMAEAWVAEMHKAGLKQIQALPVARTPEEKRALWDAVNAGGGEGVMMKRRDSGYNYGSRVNHSLKAKITSTADVVVMERNIDGKENARVGIYVGGQLKPIGTVSMQGKEKGGAVNVGDVIEVEYLWASHGTNTLQQPRMVKRRPDKAPESATDGQLRFVSKDVLDKEGWGGSTTPPGGPAAATNPAYEGDTPDAPTPTPETDETPLSPAPEAPQPPPDPVQAAITALSKSGSGSGITTTVTGDPRSDSGLTISRSNGSVTRVFRDDRGWRAVGENPATSYSAASVSDRPLSGSYPDLWRALTAGEPRTWAGAQSYSAMTPEQKADATADLDMPSRPRPPYAYGGKVSSKDQSAYYQASAMWDAEFADRLKAGGAPEVEVRVGSDAPDAELNAELARLSRLAIEAHKADAEVTDKANRAALTAIDQLRSSYSRKEVDRINAAAAPLRTEMLRRTRLRFQPAVDPDFDRSRWNGAVTRPETTRTGSASDDVLRKTRETYVVKDKNTVEKNRLLRTKPTAAAKTWRSQVNSWIRNYTSTTDGTLYRGIAVPPSVLETFRVGSTISDPGVTSTDASEDTARFYLGERLPQRPDAVPVILEILTPKGTHVVDADYGEHVLPTDTSMLVREVKVDDDGTYRVTVELPAPGGGGAA